MGQGTHTSVMTVANYLHVNPSTINRLLKRRELPAFRVGSDWRFRQDEIDRWRMEGDGLIQSKRADSIVRTH